MCSHCGQCCLRVAPPDSLLTCPRGVPALHVRRQEHPGIVGYMESFVDRASLDLCIVMQWCSGGDLTSFIKSAQHRNAKLTEADIKHQFVQMALALHFMHEKNILHRDLKAGNVFLRQHGLVQLGDFGISKVLTGASDLASTCIGTPYVSAESRHTGQK